MLLLTGHLLQSIRKTYISGGLEAMPDLLLWYCEHQTFLVLKSCVKSISPDLQAQMVSSKADIK